MDLIEHSEQSENATTSLMAWVDAMLDSFESKQEIEESSVGGGDSFMESDVLMVL